ncbi:hypothetical protein DUNSADRAFT_4342, partial [Dunaliella salina]
MALTRAFSARLLPWACQCIPAAQHFLADSGTQGSAVFDGPSKVGICAQLRSFAKKSAHQIKNGDTLFINDSISRVSTFYWNHGKARGGGSVSCDLVDVRTGAKTNVRLKNDDQVETAELRTKSFQVSEGYSSSFQHVIMKVGLSLCVTAR